MNILISLLFGLSVGLIVYYFLSKNDPCGKVYEIGTETIVSYGNRDQNIEFKAVPKKHKKVKKSNKRGK